MELERLDAEAECWVSFDKECLLVAAVLLYGGGCCKVDASLGIGPGPGPLSVLYKLFA